MFAPDPSAAAVVLPLCPLHEMYAEPARDFIIARGGEVRTSALTRVNVSSGRVAGVEVRGERLTAGAVIAAVPWFGLRGLFGASRPRELQPVLDAAAGMAAMPIVTVNLWYDRPVMQEVFAGLPGRTMQWVFDKRIAFGESASHLSLVSSGATEIVAMTNEDLSALAAREVEASLPGARGLWPIRATVVREKQATFSLAPGQPRRPGTRTAVANLFLAGDWTDTGLPATIEGAVVSGNRAAAAWWSKVSIPNVQPPTTKDTERPTFQGRCREKLAFGSASGAWKLTLEIDTEIVRNAISHRALPGNRPERKEPPVVRRAAGAQPARGVVRPRREGGPRAHGTYRDRPGCGGGLERGARSVVAGVRYRQFRESRPGGARGRGDCRGNPRRSRRHDDVDVPAVGAPGRQALSVDVARDRA